MKKVKIYLKLRLFSHLHSIISQALVSLYASLPFILCQLLFAKMDQESIILNNLESYWTFSIRRKTKKSPKRTDFHYFIRFNQRKKKFLAQSWLIKTSKSKNHLNETEKLTPKRIWFCFFPRIFLLQKENKINDVRQYYIKRLRVFKHSPNTMNQVNKKKTEKKQQKFIIKLSIHYWLIRIRCAYLKT